MADNARESFTRMVDVATRFVDEVSSYRAIESLHDSMTAELDLYQYMISSGSEKIELRQHHANVNCKLEAIKLSFEANSKALYVIVNGILNDAGSRHGRPKQLQRIERKIDNLQSVLLRDEVEGEHCWDHVSAPRRKQLLLLREWMNDPQNREKIGYGLSMGCLQSFVEVRGGYPNDRAMYNFAHRHEIEFG